MMYIGPTRLRSGGLLQSGIPKTEKRSGAAFNSLIRGMVIATYVTDDDNHPLNKLDITPTSVWCDVLAFGDFQGGSRYYFLPGVQVTQPFGGMHKGAVYKPKAATRLVSGKTLSDVTPQDVNQMDGDTVLIGFLNGKNNQPVIVGFLPHPSRDVGNSPLLPAGARQQLKLVDGDPLFFRHHASYFGIEDDGGFTVDTTRANNGQLAPSSGDAPTVPGNGDVNIRLPLTASRTTSICAEGTPEASAPATTETLKDGSYSLDTGVRTPDVRVSSNAGDAWHLSGAGAAAKAVLGSGGSPVALADALQVLVTSVKAYLDTHTHLPPVAPGSFTGPPTVPSPPYLPTITGTSLKVPSL